MNAAVGEKLSNKDEVTWLRQCETELGTGISISVCHEPTGHELCLCLWEERLNPSGLFQVGLQGLVAGASFLLSVILLSTAISPLFGVAFWIAMMLRYSKTM